MATIQDVAKLAGVSAGTVSNVLNRPGYVSEEARERVLAAMETLRFQPTQNARQFRSGRERTLGLVVADISNPFFVDVALGAQEAAKAAGSGVVITDSGDDPLREQQGLELLTQLRVQGIMITPVDEDNPKLDELIGRGIPVVFVDRVSRDKPCCWLATNDREGGRAAGEHLIDVGATRLAFVGHAQVNRQAQERLDGFREIAEARGLRVEELRIDNWTMDQGKAAAARIAARPAHERPDGVFCANDLVALGMLQEFVARGVEIPGQIKVVGYDDLVWAGAATVPLTTVSQPRKLLGQTAVNFILDEIDGRPHHHQHLLFEPALIARQSTA